jgi:hypothetical protein
MMGRTAEILQMTYDSHDDGRRKGIHEHNDSIAWIG